MLDGRYADDAVCEPYERWPIFQPMALPGLGSFYMVGQWVEPGGGVPTSAISARKLIKRLCKQDGKRFTTFEV
jgi:phytoene dehydrogenase-like protein